MRSKIKYLDYGILIPFFILMGIGFIMIYSASSDLLIINNLDPMSYLKRQLVFAVVALFTGAVVFSLKIRVFKNRSLVISALFVVVMLLLYLVFLKLVKGDSAAVNGAVGWINVGSFNIQPVELAKFVLVLYLGFVLSRRDGRFVPGKIISELTGPSFIAIVLMLLTLFQPDLGGAAILFVITIIMFSVSGIPSKRVIILDLLLISLIVLGVAFLIWWNPPFLQHSYQFQRLLSFINPFKLEQHGGAQLVNSYYAIHNGGLFGVGLGNSIQKRGYLPEPYTDFIFSIITEELGVIGAAVILALIFFLIWRIMMVGLKAKDSFNTLVCFGIATMIFIQTFFNVGAVLGLLPITGVTLPFISYGGSSLIVLTASIALVLNIAANERIQLEEVSGLEN